MTQLKIRMIISHNANAKTLKIAIEQRNVPLDFVSSSVGASFSEISQ